MHVAESLLELVGRTPLLRLRPFESPGLALYAKLEGFNPTGSIKDRTALALIEAAERSGALRPGMTVVEASSGNTGIGLAMVCRLKGYPLLVVMSRKASAERVALLRAYGARLVLTSREGGADEARRVADNIAAEDPRTRCRVSQHSSLDNVAMHEATTGREIVDQAPGPIDYFVAGLGTGGTVMGVSRALRKAYPGVRVVGVQPADAFSRQEGLRNIDKTRVPEILDRGALNEVVDVSDEDAARTARELLSRCGLFCGVSSGSVLRAALDLAERGVRGDLVMIFPDRGEKYLSTDAFRCEDEPELARPA